VEADETYIGCKPSRKVRHGTGHKHAVFALVERGGKVRSQHITGKTFGAVKASLKATVSPTAVQMSDEANMYAKVDDWFAGHKTVNHSKGEYVRGETYTNTLEGVFKRGKIGTYQHFSGEHLHRYLSEFDFRYNNRTSLNASDQERT
jgi:hypothetical protein